MLSRLSAWPLLASLLLHALVTGAPGGSVVLCLGGEHHEQHAIVVDDGDPCSSGCGHHSESRVPSLRTPHAQDCSCLDIEIAALGLRFRTTSVDDRVPPPAQLAAPLARACVTPVIAATVSHRVSGVAPPPPDGSLRALRTVRLLT